MPENHSAHRRLDSWKEIAEYLKRDSRTAIRWEKERGLPVHRVPGGKRQAVFAYPQEIDAWLDGQVLENGTEPNEHLAPLAGEGQMSVPQETPKLPQSGLFFQEIRSKGRRLLLVAVTMGILAGVLVFVSMSPRHPTSLEPRGLAQLTDDGRTKTNLRTDGKYLYFNEFEVYRNVLFSSPVTGGSVEPIATPFTNVDLQDVSNDGQSLLVTTYDGTELERPLRIIPSRGGPGRRIGDVLCRLARWSPDNQRIACARGASVTVVDLNGGQSAFVGDFHGAVVHLVWSPDSERLQFVLQDSTTRDFSAWEVPVGRQSASAAPVKVPWGTNCCIDWAWTNDGKAFVYTLYEDKPLLHIRSASSSSREDLLPVNVGTVASVTAGKNNVPLYVLIQNSNLGELLKLDPQRQSFETILQGLSALYLSYSRDGEWMTYVDYRDLSLWRSRADGSQRLRLTNRPLEVELSSWSPDGQRIAFMGRQPGNRWRIYLIDRDGGPLVEAAESEDSQGAPSFAPDGNRLAYGNVDCNDSQSCWIRTLNLTTGEVTKIPGSYGFRTARWSPDGKYIASFQPQKHELLLFDVHGGRWKVLAESVTGDNISWSRNSQYIYADSPQREKPIIERFRVPDGKRTTAVSLAALQKLAGQIDFWFGLTPDDSPILLHRFTASEVYSLDWSRR